MAFFQEHYDFSYLTSTDGKTFQPKQQNRFAIYIKKLPAAIASRIEYPAGEEILASRALLLSLKDFQRPSFSVDVQEIPNYNNTFLYPGKDNSTREIQAVFTDTYAFKGGENTLSPASILYRWYMLVNDKSFGSIGYKDYFATDIEFFILYPTGQTAEYWRYYEVWPTNIDFGKVSHGTTSEFLDITVTFKYQTARLLGESMDEEVSSHNEDKIRPAHIYNRSKNDTNKLKTVSPILPVPNF